MTISAIEQSREDLHLADCSSGGQEGFVVASRLVPFARPQHAFAHLIRRDAFAIPAQFLLSDSGDLDAQIDAIEQQP
jgi:hypothetical protein